MSQGCLVCAVMHSGIWETALPILVPQVASTCENWNLTVGCGICEHLTTSGLCLWNCVC